MDDATEKKLRLIQSLEACPGWGLWMVPWLEKRQESIEREILGPLDEDVTRALRAEHQWNKAMLELPANARSSIIAALSHKPESGNGAV